MSYEKRYLLAVFDTQEVDGMLKRKISRLKQQIGLSTIQQAKRIQEQVKELERELFELDRKRNHV